MIDSLTRELEEAINNTEPDAGVRFVHSLGDLSLPLRLTYTNGSGAAFETVGQIRWDAVNRIVGALRYPVGGE